MTQHTASTADRQNPTQHPLGVMSTPLDRDGRRGPSAWWFGLLALLPIACCGLPLLFAAGVTAGSGALLGGVTGGVLMLAGAVVLGIWEMRRHARGTRPTYTSTATTPSATDAHDATNLRPLSPEHPRGTHGNS